MKIGTIAATAAVFAGLGLGLAGTAVADDSFDGQYDVVADNSATAVWTVAPCGEGCVTISSSSGWDAQATLGDDGKYTFERQGENTVVCGDGRQLSGPMDYTVDPVELTYTARQDWATAECGAEVTPGTGKLTKI